MAMQLRRGWEGCDSALVPIFRQTSPAVVPASACCRAKAICCSVKCDFFIEKSSPLSKHLNYRISLTMFDPVFGEKTTHGQCCQILFAESLPQ